MLLHLADEYQIDQLKSECEKYLRDVDKTGLNSVRLLDTLKQFQILNLQEECIENAKLISTDILDLSVDYQRLQDESKIELLMARVKYLEKTVHSYREASTFLVDYMYRQAYDAFTTNLSKQCLDDISFLKCDLFSEHRKKKAGCQFCIHCSACRARTKHVRHFTVMTNEVICILDKLYNLVY